MKELVLIQNELKAPKNMFNSFGRYAYRSCESILTAVKPILAEHNCTMIITDDIVEIGGRIYVKATATISNDSGDSVTVSAFAREPESKKGMDEPQLTGTASSYARKYCLNGLFLIDDTKDADTDEYHRQTAQEPPEPQEPVFDRDFLIRKGQDKISEREQKRLTAACNRAGDRFTLDKALAACNRSDVTEITYVQYIALMNNLKATA